MLARGFLTLLSLLTSSCSSRDIDNFSLFKSNNDKVIYFLQGSDIYFGEYDGDDPLGFSRAASVSIPPPQRGCAIVGPASLVYGEEPPQKCQNHEFHFEPIGPHRIKVTGYCMPEFEGCVFSKNYRNEPTITYNLSSGRVTEFVLYPESGAALEFELAEGSPIQAQSPRTIGR